MQEEFSEIFYSARCKEAGLLHRGLCPLSVKWVSTGRGRAPRGGNAGDRPAGERPPGRGASGRPARTVRPMPGRGSRELLPWMPRNGTSVSKVPFPEAVTDEGAHNDPRQRLTADPLGSRRVRSGSSLVCRS